MASSSEAPDSLFSPLTWVGGHLHLLTQSCICTAPTTQPGQGAFSCCYCSLAMGINREEFDRCQRGFDHRSKENWGVSEALVQRPQLSTLPRDTFLFLSPCPSSTSALLGHRSFKVFFTLSNTFSFFLLKLKKILKWIRIGEVILCYAAPEATVEGRCSSCDCGLKKMLQN